MAMRRLRAMGARRERRGETEAHILDAAAAFLEIHPFRELTAEALMGAAGLTRTAFYRYFPDIASLVLRLYERARLDTADALSIWLAEAHAPREAIVHSIAAAARAYRKNCRVLKAVAEAAAFDPEVDAAYTRGAEAFIAAIAAKLPHKADSSEAAHEETARALFWMTERYFARELACAEEERLAQGLPALTAVWLAAVYGEA